MKRLLLLASLVAALLTFTSCQSPQAVEAMSAPINTHCPVGGELLDENASTVDFSGQTVGFCCNSCKSKWEKMSDTAKQAKLNELLQ